MHGSGGRGRACGGDGDEEPRRYDSSVNKKGELQGILVLMCPPGARPVDGDTS